MSQVTLRLVLTLPFVVGVSAATVVTAGLFFYHERQVHISLIAELVTSTYKGTNQDLQVLLEIPHLVNRLNTDAYESNLFTTAQSFETYLGRQIQQFPEVSRIAWLTAAGGKVGVFRSDAGNEKNIFTFRTPSLSPGPITTIPDPPNGNMNPFVDARTRPAFVTATQGLRWSPIYTTLTNPPALAIAAVLPIRDTQGNLEGVFAADLYLRHLQGSLNRLIRETPAKRLLLLNRSGRILVDSDLAIPSTLQSIWTYEDPWVQSALAQLTSLDPNWLQISDPIDFPLRNTSEHLVVFPVRDPYGLDWVAVEFINVEPWQVPELWWLSLGIVAVSGGVIGIGTVLSRSVSQSIDRLTQQATSLALGHPLVADPPSPCLFGNCSRWDRHYKF